MTVKEEPTTYRTEDGRKFPTRKDAERHDALAAALEDFEAAKRRFGRALAENARTADGQPFAFGHSHWAITWSGGRPWLREVAAVWGITRFGFSEVDDTVELTVDDREKARVFRISEIYSDKKRASEKWAEEVERWIADERASIDEMRKRIEAGR